MDEPLEAVGRMVHALDQQLAAARDANGRLTARIVQLEIALKTAQDDLAYYRESLEALEHLHETGVRALNEVQALSDQYLAQLRSREAEIDRLWALVMRVGP